MLAAMSCGNLEAVAVGARNCWPETEIIVAADDDSRTPGNPGVRFARRAAEMVRGRLALPEFPPNVTGTDFNDMRLAEVRGDQLGRSERRAG